LNITEVRVKLLGERSDRLRAFCSITIDNGFVVHDLRVIEGRKGLFVAMPSRKLSDKCPRCGGKNHLRASYCNDCGARLDENRARDHEKFHVDIAHPIIPACREKVQSKVLAAYREEWRRREQGVEPAHAYDRGELEDLLSEEEETGYEEEPELDEIEEEFEEVTEELEELAVVEEEETEPEPLSVAAEEAEPYHAPARPEPEPAEMEQEAEKEQEEEEDEERESGGFGEGIL